MFKTKKKKNSLYWDKTICWSQAVSSLMHTPRSSETIKYAAGLVCSSSEWESHTDMNVFTLADSQLSLTTGLNQTLWQGVTAWWPVDQTHSGTFSGAISLLNVLYKVSFLTSSDKAHLSASVTFRLVHSSVPPAAGQRDNTTHVTCQDTLWFSGSVVPQRRLLDTGVKIFQSVRERR